MTWFRPLTTILCVTGLAAACALQRPAPTLFAVDTARVGTTCRVGPDGGPAQSDRGIGGTGAPNLAERGIGGTGIEGVITGFASVCLDGLEVALAPDVPIAIDGQPAPPDSLRAGQVARVTASRLRNGLLVARRIEIRHAVSGIVDAVDGDVIVVAGQKVVVPADVARIDLARLGAAVAVSGLRRFDGAIVATRLESGVITDAATSDGQDPLTLTGRFGDAVEDLVIEAYVRLRPGHVLFSTGQSIVADPALLAQTDQDIRVGHRPAVVTVHAQPGGALLATGLREAPQHPGGTRGAVAGALAAPHGSAPGVHTTAPSSGAAAGGIVGEAPGGAAGPGGAPGGGGQPPR